ncbi:hypothetical protein [Lactobacillus sp. UCMA15818]|uniref:hypothetical protein n=1 Tax=Lactobacillus sp. UCMA15818 TaxID=2583394 RepID=UPI0025B02519|nr:hypothetical protein [Lactobacillus sp. UCMA15818]MDN2452801.1 hypothetical protein [Lactobacillus sp. UCMA15818]
MILRKNFKNLKIFLGSVCLFFSPLLVHAVYFKQTASSSIWDFFIETSGTPIVLFFVLPLVLLVIFFDEGSFFITNYLQYLSARFSSLTEIISSWMIDEFFLCLWLILCLFLGSITTALSENYKVTFMVKHPFAIQSNLFSVFLHFWLLYIFAISICLALNCFLIISRKKHVSFILGVFLSLVIISSYKIRLGIFQSFPTIMGSELFFPNYLSAFMPAILPYCSLIWAAIEYFTLRITFRRIIQ